MFTKHLRSFSFRSWLSPRGLVMLLLFVAALGALVYEFYLFGANPLHVDLYDYRQYVAQGNAVRAGLDPLGPGRHYPLPTTFWIFVPLSLLPEWFGWVWALAPFIFILYLCKRKGIVLWLFFPLLVQTSSAQLEGWLIFPMLWLLEDGAWLAPLSAVLLMTKPTVAPLAVLYAVYRWLRLRKWRYLKWFSFFSALYVLPAFIIQPDWLLRFLPKILDRAEESNVLPRGASIWAWWWHGGWTALLFPLVVLVILILVIYIARRRTDLLPTAEAVSLLTMPAIYSSSSTLLIPFLQTSREMIAMTVVSWLAVGIDALIPEGWGGVYSLIPITALIIFALRARRQSTAPLTPPSPTENIARSDTTPTELTNK